MTETSASWSIDLTEEAAQIADASLIVRARFVEAADTDHHVAARMLGPAEMRSFWPATTSEGGDDDELQKWHRPSRAAISRAEEVFQDWVIHLVHDLEHRKLLFAWSACLAIPRRYGSFRSFCKKSGRVRRTADRRLDTAFHIIASELRKSAKSLHEPDWLRVSPMMPNSGIDLATIREAASPSPTAWMAAGAKPANDPEHRDTEWADRQNARRARRMAEG